MADTTTLAPSTSRAQNDAKAKNACAASSYVLALRDALQDGLEPLGAFEFGDYAVEVGYGAESIWAVVRRPDRGGLAVRAAYAPGGFRKTRKVQREPGEAMRLEAESATGTHRVAFEGAGLDLHRLRVRAWLTPAFPLLVPFWPRDLYPLDAEDDPLNAQGRVEAAQRGPNTGLVYLALDEPAFGNVLYVQDLTQLNPYLKATHTQPMGVVGGEWPELGFLPPTPTNSGSPPTQALAAGEEIVVSDAHLVLRELPVTSEADKARQFLQMLGAVYDGLAKPAPIYRDWAERAERTLKDLEIAPEAHVKAYGRLYIRPYTDAEYPDAMVQMTVLTALHEFGTWRGDPVPLSAELAKGMAKFYDPELKTLRRYLPNVGDDKNADAVDSWYLYHPLRNLGTLALDGEDWARELFLKSLDYGIRAAHHFKYVWPIQYDVRDFSVITAMRADEEHGQTDVGGFYAYVMLQAFELTGEDRFLDEARAAIDAVDGMRFDLEYQANLTAWGAAACMRLWRVTNEAHYREQAYVYLASFFHNCEIWESELDAATHYTNFLGATALHDAPYMAMYECFDSFAAFDRFLKDSGPDLDPQARKLVTEYCKYALHRGWFYYPDALPEEVLAKEFRNGHVDRKLSFPVEDLYADGQPPGQVGQEVYGAGAAFVFASRAVHRVDDAPFHLFCNHLLNAMERTGERALSLQLTGDPGCTALLAAVPVSKAPLPACRVTLADGAVVRPAVRRDARVEFHVPADARVVVAWS